MNRAMSELGTFETSRDVSSSVAIEGKPDISPTTQFGSD
jgi:hypothetical protein